MNDVRSFVHYYSPTTLFSQVLKPILSIHVLLREITVLVFESWIIHREQLAVYLALDLLHEVRKGISIDKTALLGVMTVQIEIKGKPVL